MTQRSMTAAIIISAIAMTLIVGIRYLIVSGAFAWATSIQHGALYSDLKPQILREIGWSLASAAIYGIPAGIVAWGWANRGWTAIYTDASAYPLWYLPLSVLAYLFAHDTWFYWTHRLMHRPWWFRVAHATHHASGLISVCYSNSVATLASTSSSSAAGSVSSLRPPRSAMSRTRG